ncbi:hypothetical protein K490DRAFT_53400 [Saccharata proteae CBS 121410]|uniref:Uncharacterized protein n=1 Tax=Saccharata proteae CBS 121410 TaxID=1314787 RepID=A0A9P4I536_9PEZI|nr:hypothetical protein K490DRAFT_53400 [Saccharata proteae CBS 121410]
MSKPKSSKTSGLHDALTQHAPTCIGKEKAMDHSSGTTQRNHPPTLIRFDPKNYGVREAMARQKKVQAQKTANPTSLPAKPAASPLLTTIHSNHLPPSITASISMEKPLKALRPFNPNAYGVREHMARKTTDQSKKESKFAPSSANSAAKLAASPLPAKPHSSQPSSSVTASISIEKPLNTLRPFNPNSYGVRDHMARKTTYQAQNQPKFAHRSANPAATKPAAVPRRTKPVPFPLAMLKVKPMAMTEIQKEAYVREATMAGVGDAPTVNTADKTVGIRFSKHAPQSVAVKITPARERMSEGVSGHSQVDRTAQNATVVLSTPSLPAQSIKTQAAIRSPTPLPKQPTSMATPVCAEADAYKSQAKQAKVQYSDLPAAALSRPRNTLEVAENVNDSKSQSPIPPLELAPGTGATSKEHNLPSESALPMTGTIQRAAPESRMANVCLCNKEVLDTSLQETNEDIDQEIKTLKRESQWYKKHAIWEQKQGQLIKAWIAEMQTKNAQLRAQLGGGPCGKRLAQNPKNNIQSSPESIAIPASSLQTELEKVREDHQIQAAIWLRNTDSHKKLADEHEECRHQNALLHVRVGLQKLSSSYPEQNHGGNQRSLSDWQQYAQKNGTQ